MNSGSGICFSGSIMDAMETICKCVRDVRIMRHCDKAMNETYYFIHIVTLTDCSVTM